LRKKLAKKKSGISPELRRALDAQYAATSRATRTGETK